jgi:hypothetical protein
MGRLWLRRIFDYFKMNSIQTGTNLGFFYFAEVMLICCVIVRLFHTVKYFGQLYTVIQLN